MNQPLPDWIAQSKHTSLSPTPQAYGELQRAFEHYNGALFDRALPPCLITMQREPRAYGYFSFERFVHRQNGEKTDEIAINPAHFAVVPLLEVLQTVVHEMVHLWQYHFGSPGRRRYHNKEWADKMEEIGLMPSATGEPGGARTGERISDYAIPGGRFMQATEALLAETFTVSWLDRLPSRAPAAAEVSFEVAQTLRLVQLPQPDDKNRSRRTKYRCPKCGAQVWGKPNIKLLCGGETCEAAPFDVV